MRSLSRMTAMATSPAWERMMRSTLNSKVVVNACICSHDMVGCTTAGPDRRSVQVKPSSRAALADALLVTVLPQALLALVGGHLVALPLLTAGHVQLFFFVLRSARKRSAPLSRAVSVTSVL